MPSILARDIRTVPNLLTISRIAVLAIAIALYFDGVRVPALALAAAAGITDIVDGIVARRTGQVTRLGEILDQFSDLLFESTVLLLAIVAERFFPWWVLPLYLFREFWVVSIRRFLAVHQVNIRSSALGKAKTNLICWSMIPTFLSAFRVFPSLEPALAVVAHVGVGLGILMGYASGWQYTRQFAAAYETVARR